MKQALITLVMTLVAFTATASDKRGMRVLETGYETSGAALTFPLDANGGVDVKECTTCAIKRLSLRADTLYQIDKRTVTFAEMKAHLNSTPAAAVVVVTPVKQAVVSRIVATSYAVQ